MARPKIDLGPATHRVSAAVKALREARGLSFAELERRLAAAGRPIPSLGLRNIEAGERRVDVDELEALAEVLEVTPFGLLTGAARLTLEEFLDVVLEEEPDMELFLKRENYDGNLDVIMARVREALAAAPSERTGLDRARERRRGRSGDRGDG